MFAGMTIGEIGGSVDPVGLVGFTGIDAALQFGGEGLFGEGLGFVDHVAEIGALGAVGDFQQVFRIAGWRR